MNDTAGSAGLKPAPSAAPDVAAVRRPKLRPLKLLIPYVMRYRGRVVAALVALRLAPRIQVP